ncbi:short-chain dehydrogenase [Heliocybe sulcata]|uniref:Short-chain dehydrogenase n=1 Tax=Heliocybe sulcata TaxID=5364 RepID=A0A5C3NQH9_9AGAM|nr:short-chain dehydrogenase [Heliocybe sulcata]
MASQRKPVVVVTGASKGIGLAVTRILLESLDAVVVAISRTKTAELEDLSKAHISTLSTVECSVADAKGLTEAMASAEKTHKHIDGIILNAGVLDPLGRIDSADVDAWKSHFDVNFFSLLTALKATLPALRRSELGGKVVFVSSGAAVGGTAAWGAYNASKAAMNSLCRTLAQEEPDVVSVALRPGMVDTGMQEALRSEGRAHMKEQDHTRFTEAYSSGKLVKPEDSGHVIAALALKADKSLSGQFVSWDSDLCAAYRKK